MTPGVVPGVVPGTTPIPAVVGTTLNPFLPAKKQPCPTVSTFVDSPTSGVASEVRGFQVYLDCFSKTCQTEVLKRLMKIEP